MSQENVELVVKLLPRAGPNLVPLFRDDDAWAACTEGVAPFFHRDFETLAGGEELTVEVKEIADLGNGVTFAAIHQNARPVGIQGHVEMRDAQLHLWERGLIVHVTVYLDIDEARAAAERLAEERG